MDFSRAVPAKDIEALTLLVLALIGGISITCVSKRVRDVVLFLIMVTLVFYDRMSVNF